MVLRSVSIVSHLLLFALTCQAGNDTFNAVVVEYNPAINPSTDPQTNILNNVQRFVDIINTANDNFTADIIIFPEAALKGYYNQQTYLEVPDPADRVRPCAVDTKYEPPLIQLSCAARATATYVVINLSEKFFNSTLQRTQYFNTDVVFDLDGVVIARYRKMNLFGEADKEVPGDKALGFFDTKFGVRFGIFTCFDIIFKKPAVQLAKQYNITHFIFPSAWFSELPFLTAIQEQRFWSYSMDVVLLAAGHNMPSSGSSGTGIYLGRQDPLVYTMTEITGSFMLHAKVPKTYPGSGKFNAEATISITTEKHGTKPNVTYQDSSKGELKFKRERTLDKYTTQLITTPANAKNFTIGSSITVSYNTESTICHNNICCNFSLTVSQVFDVTRPNILRGDDYSQFYYRLAAFDGTRTYDNYAIGGEQTCAIIACVDTDISSCGIRSDDTSAKPHTIFSFYQTGFIFESISITAVFSNNDSFIGPNVLVEGTGNDYGSLLSSENFTYTEKNVTNSTVVKTFTSTKPIDNLITASLYSRVFSRDGEIIIPTTNFSSKVYSIFNVSMLYLFLVAAQLILLRNKL